jgi:hypothetical protein
MILEFLQSLTSEPQEPFLNEFQRVYLNRSDVFANADQQLHADLEKDEAYQLVLAKARTISWPYSPADRQVFRKHLRMFENAMQKHDWEEKKKAALQAYWQLLIVYGEYVTTLPNCPRAVKELFQPREFKRMVEAPLGSAIVELALNTYWTVQ